MRFEKTRMDSGKLVAIGETFELAADAIFNATTPSTYNVTGGSVIPRPGTDGLVILRAMRGLTGTAVTNGLGLAASGATRTDWAASLRNYINTTCGSNFQ